MRHRLAWGLGLLLLMFGSHGSWLNDEDDQATAFWNLSHGSLRVVDTPTQFYRFNEDVSFIARYESSGIPVGSTLLNVLAFPVSVLVRIVDAAVPLWLVLSVAAVACLWGAAGWRWPWASRDGKVSLAWLPFLGLVAAATLGFRASSPDQDLFYPYSALQAASMLAWAGGLALLWRLLRTQVPNAYARTAVLLAVALGPWMFWAQTVKYHSLAAFLVVLLCWLREGRPSVPRHVTLGLVAGLTVWSYPGPGLVVLLALALVELPTLWTHRKALLGVARRWSAMGLGLVIGLTPYVVENTVLTGSPWTPPLLAAGERSREALGFTSEVPTEAAQTASNTPWLDPVLGVIAWEGPTQYAKDLAHVLTTGQGIEGQPTGLLLVSPLLLFSAFGAWQVLRRRVRSPAADLALAVLAGHAVLLTHAATVQGGGRDVRLWLSAVPCLALLAGIGASRFLAALDRSGLRRALAISFASLLLGLGLGITIVALKYDLGGRDAHRQNLMLAWSLLSLAVVALAWAFGFVRPASRKALPVIAVGLALAVPLLWSTLYLWAEHTVIVGDDEHDGGGMFVPALDPFSEWFADKVLPKDPGYIVYDLVTGNLTYHPKYGTCTPVSNPCPSSYPIPQWVKDHPLYEGPP